MRDDREATTATDEALTDEEVKEVDDFMEDLRAFLDDPAALIERALDILSSGVGDCQRRDLLGDVGCCGSCGARRGGRGASGSIMWKTSPIRVSVRQRRSSCRGVSGPSNSRS
jgi:hypothetical protein